MLSLACYWAARDGPLVEPTTTETLTGSTRDRKLDAHYTRIPTTSRGRRRRPQGRLSWRGSPSIGVKCRLSALFRSGPVVQLGVWRAGKAIAVPPPFYFGAALLVGFLAHRALGWHVPVPRVASIGVGAVCRGLALLFGAPLVLAGTILALFVIHWTVVPREERFLEQRFGERYREYKSRVPRWL